MTPRLLKVVVQATFVTEDPDGELGEVTTQPIQFTAGQWRSLDPATWAEQGAHAVAEQLAQQTTA